MKRKRLLLLLIGFILITPLIGEAAVYKSREANISEDIIITVNGEKVPFKAALIEGRSYLPVQVIGYALNADVEWVEEGRQIHLDFKKERISLKKFNDLVSSGGKKKAGFVDNMYLYLDRVYKSQISREIVIIEDRSYLPIRAISEDMGIRSTWIEETKTIEIINPRTVDIDEDDEEHYVKELPKIESKEDYIVGNWVGNNSSLIDGVVYNKESKLFITKQDNGKYRVHRKDVIKDYENTKYNGRKTETLYENVTIDKDGVMLLGSHNGNIVVNETGTSLIPARKPYNLDGERLFGDFTNIGHLKSEYKRF